ncbi:peptidase C1B, bleomycin hydrolase [Gloeophyllum trabeum ATCC 11539]|uniref:Cysteine proteinase 1, mitochondrial n=1 Tax=Gloeophyllum trabeum (strain ATCC 11539 / FP-39264 / Madison 617) TaxID=670483 RepID=S7RK13_GLOTA|nr:peptidase C1B, bleomycin hydrolase [Gloeophyllum trabeum ATCC 11539]EPQ52974.1 peptidase C1B, bleomycin hydrolase [Gloeophyllum trabeum ATCC 11539]
MRLVSDTLLDEKRAARRSLLEGQGSPHRPHKAPKSADGSLKLSNISEWEASASSPVHTLARTVLPLSDLSVLQRRSVHVKDSPHVFNTEVEFKTAPIANQRQSGRCWLFASTNVLRYPIMKKLNLKEFELSQSYPYFYDHLNKANYFLELAIEDPELPLDSRLFSTLSRDMISDGGQWDMAVNLFETYGVVPQDIYPETVHTSLSAPMNKLLKTKVREHALVLRKLAASLKSDNLSKDELVASLRAKKEELMAETYRIITATMGLPPKPDEKFVWDYYDKDGKYHKWEGTPVEFYQQFVGKQPAESFSLINDPRNPYNTLYTVDKLGNLWGGRPVLYVNTESEKMSSTVVKLLKAGQPVFFGCDVLQQEDRQRGILDLDLFDFETPFDIKLSLSKAERLALGESSMTHAMVFTGVHLDENGKPLRYKVENAWGTNIGKEGWFVMTQEWFEQFVYQVVVPKSFAPKELVKVLEAGNPTVLPAWDPMGALA